MNISGAFSDLDQLQRDCFAGVQCTKPVIMIAMTPRTGSTHLCAALQAAGDVGRPSEIFNPRGYVEHEKQLRSATLFSEYVRSFNEEPSPLFAFKVCWIDFKPFASHWRAIFPRMRVIYLDRKDVIAQAVSMFRAETSGLWHQRAEETDQPIQGLDDKFDLALICEIMANLEREKRDWEQFFATEAITPIRVFYEAFAQDTSQTLQFISKQMRLDLHPEIGAEVGYKKLADALTDEWVSKVRRHVFQMT
jgi:trehalose 2-sulfotransferase